MSVLISGMGFLLVIVLMVLAGIGLISILTARFGSWGKAYHQLAKRYGARVFFALGRPRMTFSYAGSSSILKSVTSRSRENRKTQLIIKWHDRKLKLLISSYGTPGGIRKSWRLCPVEIEEPLGDEKFVVYSNQPELALQMLTPTTRWQIRQLIHHHGDSGVEILIHQGQMKISKPGYITEFRPLDDFVRFGLELYDQFKLAYNQEIEFVSDDAAVVVSEVKCPICSEVIQHEMVVCVRCKTPHCIDCWEYNGQCATFACSETRYFSTGARSVKTS